MSAYVFGVAGPPAPRGGDGSPDDHDAGAPPGGRTSGPREFLLALGLSLLVVFVPTALAVLSNHVFPHERDRPPVERPVLELRGGEPGG